MEACRAHPLDSKHGSLATLQQVWEKGMLLVAKNRLKEETFCLSHIPTAISSPSKHSKPIPCVRKPRFSSDHIYLLSLCLFSLSMLLLFLHLQ